MNRQSIQITDDQLDGLLRDYHPPITPPNDFNTQVMQVIATQTEANSGTQANGAAKTPWWEWLALLAGLPAITQVLALIFSVWHVTSAG